MRDLIKILDQIIEVAPDLKNLLNSVYTSTLYSAPEIMTIRWREVAMILNAKASDHPKADEISKIFSGV